MQLLGRFGARLVPLLGLVACGGYETKLAASPPTVVVVPEAAPPAALVPSGPQPVSVPAQNPTSSIDPAVDLATQRAARAKVCAPARSAAKLPLGSPLEAMPRPERSPDLRDLEAKLATACAGCHLAPGVAAGGFSYLAQLHEQTLDAGGASTTFPGFFEAAERMRDSVAAGRMPPADIRAKDPGLYDGLAGTLSRWIDAGKPELIEPPVDPVPQVPAGVSATFLGDADPAQFTDLGDCIPAPSEIGGDVERDHFFAMSERLPPTLAATDLATFDGLALARRGTVAYDVEYPLWSDHSGKLRHVHLPLIPSGDGRTLERATIDFVAAEKRFAIPENARFYKTFLKGAHPIETRLIVVRHPPRAPLFGTYVWNEAGTEATLLTEPYRDGTPWKDAVFDAHGRKYVVPARHRCVECHMGADSNSFVLGFTPLQIHRRALGEAGRDEPTAEDELSQDERLAAYGFVRGVSAERQLPMLERYPSASYLNDFTLRAQGYAIGNCAHCHNPNGLAMKVNGVKLSLAAGEILKFNTQTHSKDYSNRRFVDDEGSLERSYLYFRVAATAEQQGLLSTMPLHTVGGPDCQALRVFGQWILSLDARRSAEEIARFTPSEACNSAVAPATGTFAFTLEDFTAAGGDSYAPRRRDWNDPAAGMPASYRDLTLTPDLAAVIAKEYAVDFWKAKPECRFAPVDLPVAEQRPWMLKNDGTPKQPFGELYYSTPGAWYYTTTCSKCHGDRGKGDGPIGRSLAQWSGGEVQVADFIGGMFGAGGRNLQFFDVPTAEGAPKSLAPQYLIWMAIEGTRINVPPQAERYLGRHKAQMLRQVKDRCARQIKTSPKPSTERYVDHEIFRTVCLFDNAPIDAPEIQYDPATDLPVNEAAQEAWLDRAALNAGFAIYRYLKEDLSKGKVLLKQTECEKRETNG